jgi:hypothetical protein
VNQNPRGNQGYQGTQDYQGSPGYQGTQEAQGAQDYRENQGYQQDHDFSGNRGYQGGGQGFPSGQGYPSAQGSPEAQGYPDAQGYPGAQGYPQAQGSPGRAGRVRGAGRRRRRWPWITLIVIILVLIGADRAGNAIAEDQMASQFQSSLELSGKPTVTIAGFPFLTQLAARDFKTVNVSASNETAGTGGVVEISSLTAVVHGMHIQSRNSAELDQFSASALITFTALAKAGGIPQGISLSADGPNKVKAGISIFGLDETAVAQVTQTGNQIHVKVIDAGDIPTEALGNLANFTVSIPKLPTGVKVQSVSVTQQGLRITASGQHVSVSQ